MSTPRLFLAVALAAVSTAAFAESPKLGRPITEQDIAAWDIAAMPSGAGLPPGGGNAVQGAKVFAEKCAACHGEGGKGGISAAVVGAPPIKSIDTTKTIANFWGYSTTVFDYVRRAMPWMSPRTLTDDEVYALTAFILAQNKIIGDNDVMNAQTLPKVKMPNADNFIIKFPDKI